MKEEKFIIILVLSVFALFNYEIGGWIYCICVMLFFAGAYLSLIGIAGLVFFIAERIQNYRRRNRKA